MILNRAWNLKPVAPSPQFRSPKAARTSLLAQLDVYTYEHSMRVKQIALEIGEILELSNQELAGLGNAALFHDIGKLKTPQSILMKKGALTEFEHIRIRQHSRHGYDLWLESGGYYGVAVAILCHHERFNGSGYPSGLFGEDIPLWSRIISVADAIDAMVIKRSYSDPIELPDALERIRAAEGTQFDPFLVAKTLFDKPSFSYKSLQSRLEQRVYLPERKFDTCQSEQSLARL